jgi:hypothetical protein
MNEYNRQLRKAQKPVHADKYAQHFKAKLTSPKKRKPLDANDAGRDLSNLSQPTNGEQP